MNIHICISLLIDSDLFLFIIFEEIPLKEVS